MPIVLNGSGPVTGVTSLNTTVSDTEIGYLDGVTSAIQSQINTAGGLVKITDSTFSAQSTVSVNNCFSSTYSNYLMLIEIDSQSATQAGINCRLRASGSDNSTSNYQNQLNQAYGTTAAGVRGANATSASITLGQSVGPSVAEVSIFGPNLAKGTSFLCKSHVHGNNTIAQPETVDCITYHNVATAFDGFTLFPATGNFTGTVRVYGFRN